jgi:protein SCO1/2
MVNSARKPLYLLGAGIGALSLIALGVLLSQRSIDPPAASAMRSMDTAAATVLPKPVEIAPFLLTDHKGQAFTKETLKGRWTLLFFGYTSCPDVCPATLAVITQASRLLEEPSSQVRPRVVFVSVDPERDTPQRLAEYVAYFSPDFIGATGSEAQLQALTRPLGIAYLRSSLTAPGGGYLVDHSATILMLDPQGRLRALTSPPHDPAAIARDFRRIVARFGAD